MEITSGIPSGGGGGRTGFESDRKDGQTDLGVKTKGRELVERCRLQQAERSQNSKGATLSRWPVDFRRPTEVLSEMADPNEFERLVMASFSPEEWKTLELNEDFMKRVRGVSSSEEAEGLITQGGKIVEGMSDEQHFGRPKLNRSPKRPPDRQD